LTRPPADITLVGNIDEEIVGGMIGVEAWTTIRYLRAQGKGIREIGRELSISRNTVRAALEREDAPRYVRGRRPFPELDRFEAEIRRMYLEQGLIGTRIFRELVKQGYRGKTTALYSRLRALKAERGDSRITERFETGPGQQGQFDWSPYTISLGGETVKVIVYCLTLAYSRRKFYWPSLDETQMSIFEALEAGLRHFGGSPGELLVDNPRAFVTNANPMHFEWNRYFLELCGHYSIEPVACQPGRPRTKGKVERPFFYLEQQFIKGRSWGSFDAFARELAAFCTEELDQLVHSTTGERPIDRFEAEREKLAPLPDRPFVGTHEEMRKVSWDCLVSFAGSKYSVPWEYAGKRVWVRASQGTHLLIRNQKGEEIARHVVSARKGATVMEKAHYEGLRRGLPKTRTVLEESFARLFPDHGYFLEGLFLQHRPNGAAHLRGVLALAELYPREALTSAFEAAREYNTYSHTFVRGLLESIGATRAQQPTSVPVRTVTGRVVVDLREYQRILEAKG
jgi:transposase